MSFCSEALGDLREDHLSLQIVSHLSVGCIGFLTHGFPSWQMLKMLENPSISKLVHLSWNQTFPHSKRGETGK